MLSIFLIVLVISAPLLVGMAFEYILRGRVLTPEERGKEPHDAGS